MLKTVSIALAMINGMNRILNFANSKEYNEVATSSCIENNRNIPVNIRLGANRD